MQINCGKIPSIHIASRGKKTLIKKKTKAVHKVKQSLGDKKNFLVSGIQKLKMCHSPNTNMYIGRDEQEI